MEPAPLPPHERSWRHPSELAPTGVVDRPGEHSSRRAVVLAGGATVAVLALVLVATVSTGRSPAPFAVSATTMPVTRIEVQRQSASAATVTAPDDLRVWRSADNAVTRSSVLAISGAPNAVSAAPVVDPDLDSLALATDLPDDDERVIVLTSSHTYRVPWRGIDEVVAPDDAIVMTLDGALVAVFVSGEMRLLVDV